jgi:hypothetical protein
LSTSIKHPVSTVDERLPSAVSNGLVELLHLFIPGLGRNPENVRLGFPLPDQVEDKFRGNDRKWRFFVETALSPCPERPDLVEWMLTGLSPPSRSQIPGKPKRQGFAECGPFGWAQSLP